MDTRYFSVTSLLWDGTGYRIGSYSIRIGFKTVGMSTGSKLFK